VTHKHIEAVEALITEADMPREDIKLIGFHGQTIRHDPAKGITQQIGNPSLLVAKTGISVVSDFRSRDVAEGGQGAPLVPFYHAARAAELPKPLMIVNIGGVANVTYLGANREILALDCGPGNALMDDWMRYHAGTTHDEGGELASRGEVDTARIENFLRDPFFALPAPKSLDRNHFSIQLAEGLTAADGVATLAAFTVEAIAKSFEHVHDAPKQLLVAGGGRHNVTLMKMLTARLQQVQVAKVEEVGWNGDALEAEAFAYLAVRSYRGLRLSLPSTTGVKHAVTGGALHLA
jgi:anhydro-N-acetylmuramic acid kinase